MWLVKLLSDALHFLDSMSLGQACIAWLVYLALMLVMVYVLVEMQ